MSQLPENGEPSTGAIQKTTLKSKRSSRKKKNDCIEAGNSVSVQMATGAERSGDETRCKKRNKSVSFALNGEGTSKKSKKNPRSESRIFRNTLMKKNKESKAQRDQVNQEMEASTSTAPLTTNLKRKASSAKGKVQDEQIDTAEANKAINPRKKHKKRKHSKRSAKIGDEPRTNMYKTSTPENDLTSQLENLHIGPDTDEVVSLVDEVVPASPKQKKTKKVHTLPPETMDNNENVSNEFDLKKVVKWTKKRWNKDRKGATMIGTVNSSVVIQNLPEEIMSEYRTKLTDVFEKFGRIKRIGSPLKSPDADSSVYSTTIYFDSEEAANAAISLDNSLLAGSAIRVVRSRHPTETTAVVRCRSEPTASELRAIFGDVGPLGDVQLNKRRGSVVAFLQFDGPEAVHRALALSGVATFNGKTIYVNKFEIRTKNSKQTEKADNIDPPLTKV